MLWVHPVSEKLWWEERDCSRSCSPRMTHYRMRPILHFSIGQHAGCQSIPDFSLRNVITQLTQLTALDVSRMIHFSDDSLRQVRGSQNHPRDALAGLAEFGSTAASRKPS